jgi:hypothetical protein
LGLAKIIERCTAEKLSESVNNHLALFSIEIFDSARDIVAATGDVASVMLKFGRSSMKMVFRMVIIMKILISSKKLMKFLPLFVKLWFYFVVLHSKLIFCTKK